MALPNQQTYPDHTRILGYDKAAAQLLVEAKMSQEYVHLATINVDRAADFDYAQIDPSLKVVEPTASTPVTIPSTRVGYGGLTPQQRYRLLTWLHDPLTPAPPPIRQLYIAQLEASLFDSTSRSANALNELNRLLDNESWHQDIGVSRATLLGLWLQQDSSRLESLLCYNKIAPSMVGIAVGQLALQGTQLSFRLFRALVELWFPQEFAALKSTSFTEILDLRFASITTTTNKDPLIFAITQAGQEASRHIPWRCTHRDLRVSIPQPNIESLLKLLIQETLDGVTLYHPNQSHRFSEPSSVNNNLSRNEPSAENESAQPEWSLVLEFGHSRSEYFDFAIFRARQRPGYSQIMDEDRTLIHRVVFARAEMRHFWILWEYVQNWSSTKVYVNGEELEKWKVWPYSQFLR